LIRAQYSVCFLSNPPVSVGIDFTNGKYYEVDKSGPKQSNFVVKIQLQLLPAGRRRPVIGGPMMVYNKDKTLYYLLERKSNEDVHPRLEKLIMNQGVDGLKGYFHAILSPTKVNSTKININVENILPRESW